MIPRVSLAGLAEHGVGPGGVTTAHDYILGFYTPLLTGDRKKSVVEEIASARSRFQVDVILDDFRRFADPDKKTEERVARAAYVRRCQLDGVLP